MTNLIKLVLITIITINVSYASMGGLSSVRHTMGENSSVECPHIAKTTITKADQDQYARLSADGSNNVEVNVKTSTSDEV